MRFHLLIAFMTLTSTWAAAQFSPGDLSAAHADLEGLNKCTECHTLGKEINENKCKECHEEITVLIEADRGYHASREVERKSCIDCHSEHHGRRFNMVRFDEDNFDHELTGYALEGGHGEVECRDCHTPDNIADPDLKKRRDTYLGLEDACLSCHDDYHQKTLSENCLDCHVMDDWEPASKFDHAETNFPLRGKHARVDCIDCHEKSIRNGQDFQEFANVPFAACTDCHTDNHDGKFGNRCTDCHTEQSWHQLKSNNTFDHNLTDYPLEGMHSNVDCKECHKRGSYNRALAHDKCLDCHKDFHEGDFMRENGQIEDCAACHTLDRAFTSTTYKLTQHQESQFPLEGAHIATPCFACHQSEDQRWEFNWETNACVTCHNNIHEGYISEEMYPEQSCETCHNSERWNLVTFDHNKTNYSLVGAHAEAKCTDCHWKGDLPRIVEQQQFKGTSQDCASCHNSPHGDQFAKNGVTTCTDCHLVSTVWNADGFDHNTTKFPLTGKHENVDCTQCHKPELTTSGEERIIYQIPQFECIDCHGS